MKKIIEFSDCNLKLLLFLMYPIFITVSDYTYITYIKEDNFLFITFRYFSCYIFSGILLIIFKSQTKRKSKQTKKVKETELQIININDNNIDIHKSHEEKQYLSQVEIEQKKIFIKKIINFIIFLTALAALGIFSVYAGYYFKKKTYSNAKYSVRTFFEITNFAVLSYFILHQKLYKHHFISYGLTTLILIILFIISYPDLQDIGFSILFYFCYELCFSLYDVLIKKFMNVFYKTPYFTMFWLGLLCTVLLLIYDTIAYFTNPDVSGIIIGFKDNINSVGDFFYFLLDIFVEYLWNLGIWFLIFYFTPCHYFISEYISEYFYYISKVVESKDNDFFSNKNCILFSVCFFLIMIFSLIFNEVVILNFCKLDFYTNKRIYERNKGEYDITLINQNKLLYDDEEELERNSTIRESSIARDSLND